MGFPLPPTEPTTLMESGEKLENHLSLTYIYIIYLMYYHRVVVVVVQFDNLADCHSNCVALVDESAAAADGHRCSLKVLFSFAKNKT